MSWNEPPAWQATNAGRRRRGNVMAMKVIPMKAPPMPQRPDKLKRIRLELARSKEFPDGSAARGYEFVAPLNGDAHIDPALWHKYRDRCRVHRFWGDEEEVGHLVHRPGGPEHAQWVFDYEGTAEHDDETGYRFGAHAFRPGEYVSIRDPAAGMHTFRVVSVTSAT